MNRQTWIASILMLALGAGGGYWLSERLRVEKQPAQAEAKSKPLFYRNPMNPEITSPVPAKDPMGMDYIPVYADRVEGQTEKEEGLVSIDPVTVQNMGVRTIKAKRTEISHSIRAVGRIVFNEERLARIHSKTEGWVEKLYVDKTGEWVAKDRFLLSLYSPQLVASQQEYLLALNSLKVLEKSPIEDIRKGAEDLVKTSRERLKLLDVPEHQIHELEHSRKIKKNLHIHSPFGGVVMKIGVREGQYITPATELYMLADLSKVWVLADIYEYELPWVREGDDVEMQLASVPGTVFHGRLAYIYPYAESKTRTIKVRLEFDNPGMSLKPELFADITIHANRQLDAVVIPAEAVLRSGVAERVFVVRAPGKFEPRIVKLGLGSEGLVQVLEGLEAGEEVVVSSQFLIDSESKLREAMKKMQETDGQKHRRNGAHPID